MVIESRVVAVVEDDTNMMKGIERLLGAHGFRTEAYTSAEAYLNNFAMSKANCLLLDIQLQGMSGIELRRTLAASGSNLAVIFMTATDSDETQKEAIAAGCVAYLRKPFPANLLIDAIGRAAC